MQKKLTITAAIIISLTGCSSLHPGNFSTDPEIRLINQAKKLEKEEKWEDAAKAYEELTKFNPEWQQRVTDSWIKAKNFKKAAESQRKDISLENSPTLSNTWKEGILRNLAIIKNSNPERQQVYEKEIFEKIQNEILKSEPKLVSTSREFFLQMAEISKKSGNDNHAFSYASWAASTSTNPNDYDIANIMAITPKQKSEIKATQNLLINLNKSIAQGKLPGPYYYKDDSLVQKKQPYSELIKYYTYTHDIFKKNNLPILAAISKEEIEINKHRLSQENLAIQTQKNLETTAKSTKIEKTYNDNQEPISTGTEPIENKSENEFHNLFLTSMGQALQTTGNNQQIRIGALMENVGKNEDTLHSVSSFLKSSSNQQNIQIGKAIEKINNISNNNSKSTPTINTKKIHIPTQTIDSADCNGKLAFLSPFMQNFQDINLRNQRNAIINTRISDIISKAKEEGFNKNTAIALINQQEDAYWEIASAAASTAEKTDGDPRISEIALADTNSLAINFVCDGTHGGSVCSYIMNKWGATASHTTSKILQRCWY